MLLKLNYLILGFVLILASCSDDPVKPVVDYKPILQQTTNEVIIKTYFDLDQASLAFLHSVESFISDPTQTRFEELKQAWRTARKPWEQAEGFLFGPVDQQGIDPSIDSWPVNVIDLDAVLNSPDALTKEYIDGLEGTLKGFHTSEYLIFGTNGAKSIQEFTNRQLNFLNAVAQSLHGECNKLYKAWTTGNPPYGDLLRNAGETSNLVYLSQKSALQELLDGMITITDEVGNGKINDPFVQSNLIYEESRFSANSKADFADNIRSVQNIYFGSVNAMYHANSLAQIVLEKNAVLDEKVRNQIQKAIQSIEAIPGTFSEAVFQNRPSIQNAQDQVRLLQTIFESELKPFLESL